MTTARAMDCMSAGELCNIFLRASDVAIETIPMDTIYSLIFPGATMDFMPLSYYTNMPRLFLPRHVPAEAVYASCLKIII